MSRDTNFVSWLRVTFSAAIQRATLPTTRQHARCNTALCARDTACSARCMGLSVTIQFRIAPGGGGGGGGGGGAIRQEATYYTAPKRHDTALYAPRHGASACHNTALCTQPRRSARAACTRPMRSLGSRCAPCALNLVLTQDIVLSHCLRTLFMSTIFCLNLGLGITSSQPF